MLSTPESSKLLDSNRTSCSLASLKENSGLNEGVGGGVLETTESKGWELAGVVSVSQLCPVGSCDDVKRSDVATRSVLFAEETPLEAE